MLRRTLASIFFLAVVAGAVPAFASPPPETELRLKATTGIGGSFDSQVHLDAEEGEGDATDVIVDDLMPSFGGAAELEIGVHRFLAIGLLTNFAWWTTDRYDDQGMSRSLWMDFDFLLKGRIGTLGDRLFFYLSVPVGLSISRFSDALAPRAGTRWGHGIGFNVSTIAGVEWWYLDAFSVFLEGGWTFRQWTHTSAETVFGTPSRLELEGVTNQIVLSLGLGFDL